MATLTLDTLRKRAEHNDGVLATATELSLHQLHAVDVGPLSRCARRVTRLSLVDNALPRVPALPHMKDLTELNLALNAIVRVTNLSPLEYLTHVDMTGTFVRPGTLRSSASALASAPCLINVSLAGTPASTWPHYRPYLVLRVPRLRVLDGKIIGAGERVAARAGASVLHAAAAAAETADAAGRGVIIDSSYDADADDAAEAAAALAAAAEVVGGGAGAFDGARAWSRVTRLADALAAVTQAKESDEKKSEAVKSVDTDHAASVWPRTLAGTRTSLPPLPADGSLPPQTNEGDWEFTLDVTPDGGAVELTVSLGRGVRAGWVDAHVSPRAVRVLAAGCLLTVHLPLTVDADAAVARRSAASGALVVTVPRALSGERVDVALLRPRVESGEEAQQAQQQRGVAAAVVTVGESLPPLV